MWESQSQVELLDLNHPVNHDRDIYRYWLHVYVIKLQEDETYYFSYGYQLSAVMMVEEG